MSMCVVFKLLSAADYCRLSMQERCRNALTADVCLGNFCLPTKKFNVKWIFVSFATKFDKSRGWILKIVKESNFCNLSFSWWLLLVSNPSTVVVFLNELYSWKSNNFSYFRWRGENKSYLMFLDAWAEYRKLFSA